ncbi:MAG TPA: DNA-3-methyladenine glycosylase I [Desulfobacteraceae bacterium]|nr:DNA-3-methyladenine glycosylase I [Desulfobacteraceae bacterium]
MCSDLNRCVWAKSELAILYHDQEWGVPCHDDRILFEFLVLEGAQSGLSWETVLCKREHYRKVFDGFEPAVVAGYDESKIASLLRDPGIIRNRKKVQAAVSNAEAFLEVQQKFGSFDAYLWRFVDGRPVQHHRKSYKEIPPFDESSIALGRDLKQRGFRFVGPTICYAFMQAVGMVNDHTVDCFRYPILVE